MVFGCKYGDVAGDEGAITGGADVAGKCSVGVGGVADGGSVGNVDRVTGVGDVGVSGAADDGGIDGRVDDTEPQSLMGS